MIKFLRCNFEKIKDRVLKYYGENKILIDSYFEERVLSGTFYEIEFNNIIVGYCGINNKRSIILFSVDDEYMRFVDIIFNETKKLEEVEGVLVPTGDEMLIGLALDNFKSIEKDSYYTYDGDKTVEANQNLTLELATIDNKEKILSLSNNYYEDIDKKLLEKSIYLVYCNNTIVGFGHFHLGTIRPEFASIGLYVREEFRGKNIGTNILITLKELAYSKGKSPVAGCWCYNHNSLKTQMKAGLRCKTRLLNIKF